MSDDSVIVKVRNPYVEHNFQLVLSLQDSIADVKRAIALEYPGKPVSGDQKLIHGGKLHPDSTTLEALLPLGVEEVEDERCLVFHLMLPGSLTREVQEIVSPRVQPQAAPEINAASLDDGDSEASVPREQLALQSGSDGQNEEEKVSILEKDREAEEVMDQAQSPKEMTLSDLAAERKKRADAALRRVSLASQKSSDSTAAEVSAETQTPFTPRVEEKPVEQQQDDSENVPKTSPVHQAVADESSTRPANHTTTAGSLPSPALGASPQVTTPASHVDDLMAHHQSIQAMLTHQLHLSHQLGMGLGIPLPMGASRASEHMSQDLYGRLHPTLDSMRHRHPATQNSTDSDERIKRYQDSLLHATTRLHQVQMHQTMVAQHLHHQEVLRAQANNIFAGLTLATPTVVAQNAPRHPSSGPVDQDTPVVEPRLGEGETGEEVPAVPPRPYIRIHLRFDFNLILKMLFIYYLFGYNAPYQTRVTLISLMVVTYLFMTGFFGFLGFGASGNGFMFDLLQRLGRWVTGLGQIPDLSQENRAFTDIRCIASSFILSMLPSWQVLQVPAPAEDEPTSTTVDGSSPVANVNRQDDGIRNEDNNAMAQPRDQPLAAV